MGKVESSVTIARPVEDVYRHFLDLDQNATDPDTQSVDKEPPGHGAGDALSVPPRKGPRDNDAFRLT